MPAIDQFIADVEVTIVETQRARKQLKEEGEDVASGSIHQLLRHASQNFGGSPRRWPGPVLDHLKRLQQVYHHHLHLAADLGVQIDAVTFPNLEGEEVADTKSHRSTEAGSLDDLRHDQQDAEAQHPENLQPFPTPDGNVPGGDNLDEVIAPLGSLAPSSVPKGRLDSFGGNHRVDVRPRKHQAGATCRKDDAFTGGSLVDERARSRASGSPGGSDVSIRSTSLRNHPVFVDVVGGTTALNDAIDDFLANPGVSRATRLKAWIVKARAKRNELVDFMDGRRRGPRDACHLQTALVNLTESLALGKDTLNNFDFGRERDVQAENQQVYEQLVDETSGPVDKSRPVGWGELRQGRQKRRERRRRHDSSSTSSSEEEKGAMSMLRITRTPVKDFSIKVGVRCNQDSRSSGMEDYLRAHCFAREALADLPTFSGGTREYAYWRENVVPLLNYDERGATVSFNTLNKLVVGEAKALIAHVKPSSSNPVKEAFDIWDTYYGQPSSMLQVMRKELADWKKPDFNNAVRLGEFISIIKSTMEAYESAGLPVKGQYWFFEEVFNKFDEVHIEKFCARHRNQLNRTVDQLLSYLQDRFEVLCSKPGFALKMEKSARIGGSGVKGAAAIVAKPSDQKQQTPQKQKQQSQPNQQGQNKKGNSESKKGKKDRKSIPKYDRDRPPKGVCPDCNQPGHGVVVCPQFLKRTPQERIYLIWLWYRCFSCFKPHGTTGCTLPADFKCGEGGCTYKHHPLLHGSGSLYKAQLKYLPTEFLEKHGLCKSGEPRDDGGSSDL